jgi:hypothetical protein
VYRIPFIVSYGILMMPACFHGGLGVDCTDEREREIDRERERERERERVSLENDSIGPKIRTLMGVAIKFI